MQSTPKEIIRFSCPTCGSRVAALVEYGEEYRLGPLVYKDEGKRVRSHLVCAMCGMRFRFMDKEPSGEGAVRLVQVVSLPSWHGWRLYGERFTVRIATYVKRRRRKGKEQRWLQTMAFFPSKVKTKPDLYFIELKSDGSILLQPIGGVERRQGSERPSLSETTRDGSEAIGEEVKRWKV